MDESLIPFFHPRGIVIVGVSHDPTKLGYGAARNLVDSGYTGAIHFVNPKGGSLFNRPIFPDIASLPDPVDLAVLIISAQAVPEAIRACGERGLRAAIIASGGFREVGPEGAALEAKCLAIAKEWSLRLLGPNCVGVLDTHAPFDTTFLPPPGPLPGDVAFVSHSGAICEAVIDWASGQGFGLSQLVSLGNQADVNETDVLEPVAADPFTRVLTLYIEGITSGRRFIEEASKVTRRKPVIALKVGRFAGGLRAVASHTGALAGQEAAYNAAFRRAGVIRAETTEEMFDWARALAWCPLPKGRNIAVLTNAGGPGAIAADAIEAYGLHLAELGDETRSALRVLLPPSASLLNPVDMLASASPEQYAGSLRLVLTDPAVDGVMVILPPPPMYTAESVAEALIPVIHDSSKPVVIALMGEMLIRRAAELLRAARIADYRFPERAASALALLAQRTDSLARSNTPATLEFNVNRQAAQIILDGSPVATNFLSQEQAGRLLAAYSIATPRVELARTADEAASIARQLGFPVALKVASPDISHKSDVGGVLLNLGSEAAVVDGFANILRNARAAQPQARLSGVHVQRMIPAGQEVIIGVVQDSQFGPLVMFGSGGVEVEGLKDVAFGLAPLSCDEAGQMLDSTWAGRRLRGYRNLPPADRAAMLGTMIRLAQLAYDFPKIAEIEINPLRVLPAGQGAVAVDVRVKLK
jgi:acetyltransferase